MTAGQKRPSKEKQTAPTNEMMGPRLGMIAPIITGKQKILYINEFHGLCKKG